MIKLWNYPLNSFTTHFPLLYLHGNCSSTKKTCRVGKNEEDDTSSVSCTNKSLKSAQSWPLKRNEFKAFLFLKRGRNEIVLTYDLEELVLEVDFKKNRNERFLLPVYIICDGTDGSFEAPGGYSANSSDDAVAKIKFNVRLMQTYLAESLFENKFERKTLDVAEDETGEVLVKVFNSKLNIDETNNMTPDNLYAYFHKELTKSLPQNGNCKYVCFMSCTRYHPPEGKDVKVKDIMSYVKGHAALGGGNMALFGTGSFHTWAEDLDEFTQKFSDETIIDRTKYFDDSCGRGTYAANYSTTLGATIHEIGHCFDLAHTPHGIMARGHDNMDYFYTVKQPVEPLKDESTVASKSKVQIGNDGKYKGAHWFRSSAVVLNHHKWLNPLQERKTSFITRSVPSMSLHPDLLGPVGNNGPACQKNQIRFDSRSFLDELDLKLIGVIFYHGDYLYGLQFVGGKFIEENGVSSCQGGEVSSPVFGTSPASCEISVFPLNYPHEEITEIKINSGAWIDGIQVMTSIKSSTWYGGQGGDEVHLKTNGRRVLSWLGTAGETVGSLAFKLENDAVTAVDKTSLVTFSSNHGVRLVELRNDHGEVSEFHEYIDDPPPRTVSLDVKDRFEGSVQRIDGMVFDDGGEKLVFSMKKQELDLIT